MTVELVTYANLKSFLDLEGETISSYPGLALIQSSVTAAIESYLGRELTYGSYELTKHVRSSTSLIRLNALPIDCVDAVTITQYGETEALTSDDYDITDYGIYLYSPVSRATIYVEYDGGYADADVPSSIARAALLQVTMEFQSKDNVGASMVSTEGGMVRRPELGLLDEVKRMLNPYQHPLSWGNS